PVSANLTDPKPRPRRAPAELPGRTIDYAYDAKDVKDPTRACEGRAFLHDRAVASHEPLPLIVFLHGLNRELIPHRWMGGGTEGDVRRLVADLVDRGVLPPVILAGPGSVAPAAVSGGASFPVDVQARAGRSSAVARHSARARPPSCTSASARCDGRADVREVAAANPRCAAAPLSGARPVELARGRSARALASSRPRLLRRFAWCDMRMLAHPPGGCIGCVH